MSAASQGRAETFNMGKMMLLFMALLVGAWSAPVGCAQAETDPGVLERRVKAAFLYKFAGYVIWPEASFPRPETPVAIAVMGADPLAAELEELVTGHTVNSRTITVRRLRFGEATAGIHILFIGRQENSRIPQVVAAAQPYAVLTVTESEGALSQGSMINFITRDGRVQFEISLDATEKSGLSLSSRLLAVAQQVRKGAF